MPLEEPFEVKVAKSENHQSNDDDGDDDDSDGDDDDDDDDDDDGDDDDDSDGELVFINRIITLLLNFSRKSTIAVTGSTALCSVVPVTATTLMTGISLSNFSLRIRCNSKR